MALKTNSNSHNNNNNNSSSKSSSFCIDSLLSNDGPPAPTPTPLRFRSTLFGTYGDQPPHPPHPPPPEGAVGQRPASGGNSSTHSHEDNADGNWSAVAAHRSAGITGKTGMGRTQRGYRAHGVICPAHANLLLGTLGLTRTGEIEGISIICLLFI